MLLLLFTVGLISP